MEGYTTQKDANHSKAERKLKSNSWRNSLRHAIEIDREGKFNDAMEQYKFIYSSTIGKFKVNESSDF